MVKNVRIEKIKSGVWEKSIDNVPYPVMKEVKVHRVSNPAIVRDNKKEDKYQHIVDRRGKK